MTGLKRKQCLFVICLLTLGMTNLQAYAETELKFLLQDSTGKPVPNAVVALYDGKSSSATTNTVAEIAQKDKQFVPKLTVIQTGMSVQFPNQDKVRHHVYSFSPAKKFEIKLYSGLPAAPVKFDQPGLVTLGCNIHDTMLGYVHIVETPYFAKTDGAGQAVVRVADSEYTYKVWHAGDAKPVMEQKIKVTDANTLKLTVSVASPATGL